MPFTHIAIADLGFGDAGKGSVVDWLCSSSKVQVRAVIRYNGGAQAAHNVVLEDGRHHTFAQFGSGTLRGVHTILSRYMMVNPLTLIPEAKHLMELGEDNPFTRLRVDGEALITTPFHMALNRLLENARRFGRHGSCGMGVGVTREYAELMEHDETVLRVNDLRNRRALVRKLDLLAAWCKTRVEAEVENYRLTDAAVDKEMPFSVEEVADLLIRAGDEIMIVDPDYVSRALTEGTCVFEGAQGVLLDENHGFAPYNTWSDTTFSNAAELCRPVRQSLHRIGVLRTYTTRHGEGPLVTYDNELSLPELHNVHGEWQGAFRVGHFDSVTHRYAAQVADGPDALVLTHVDSAESEPRLRICDEYLMPGDVSIRRLPAQLRGTNTAILTAALMQAKPVLQDEAPVDWISAIRRAMGVPVAAASYGPTAKDKMLISSSVLSNFGL